MEVDGAAAQFWLPPLVLNLTMRRLLESATNTLLLESTHTPRGWLSDGLEVVRLYRLAPAELNTTTRPLLASVAYTLPAESTATPLGEARR